MPTAVSDPVGVPVAANGSSLRDGLGEAVAVIGDEDAECDGVVDEELLVDGAVGGAEVGGGGGGVVGRAATVTVTVAVSWPNLVLAT
jgi:hypothetical protein